MANANINALCPGSLIIKISFFLFRAILHFINGGQLKGLAVFILCFFIKKERIDSVAECWT